MIPEAAKLWEANQALLKKHLEEKIHEENLWKTELTYRVCEWEEDDWRNSVETYENLSYDYLVRLVVQDILNSGKSCKDYRRGLWDNTRIHKIDDGEYSGTLLYLIPRCNYMPDVFDYIYTFVYYGSCSYCDLLLGIVEPWDQEGYGEGWIPEKGQLEGKSKEETEAIWKVCKDKRIEWCRSKEPQQVHDLLSICLHMVQKLQWLAPEEEGQDTMPRVLCRRRKD